MFEHRTHRHFAELLVLQIEFFDQGTECLDRHAHIAQIEIHAVIAAERNTDATENGYATGSAHGEILIQGQRLALA